MLVLDPMPGPPDGAVFCLLCRGTVGMVEGNRDKYQKHLTTEHGVFYNRDWLVEWTVTSQLIGDREAEATDKEREATDNEENLTGDKVYSEISSPEIVDNSSEILSKELNIVKQIRIHDPKPTSVKRPFDDDTNDNRIKKIKVTEISAVENSGQMNSTFSTKEMVQSAMKRCDVRVKNENFSKYWTDENFELVNGIEVKPSIIKFSKAEAKQKENQKLYSDDFAEECKTKCGICNKIFKLSFLNTHVKNDHEMEIGKYLKEHGDPKIVVTGVIERNEISQHVSIYHKCKICGEEMVMTKQVVENHVKSCHSVNLLRYIAEYMKVKQNEKAEPRIETTDEDAELDKLTNLRRRSNKVKYCDSNDESSSEDEKSSKLMKTVDENGITQKEKRLTSVSNIQEKKSLNSHLGNSTKTYSDNYENACQIECQICYQVLFANYLRGHTQSKHQMDITSYKKKFGPDYTFIVKSFHKCKMCGMKMLLDQDTIASHVRRNHETSLKDYNAKYMKHRKEAQEKEKDQNLSLDNKSLENPKKSSNNRLKNINKELVPSKSTKESKTESQVSKMSKPKLVENDHQWFNGNTFSCKVCSFKTTSLDNFKCHVKADHNTSLQKFSDNYIRTMVKYECKICSEQVDHEKSAIKDHVESHFLSIDKYGTFYEKKIIENKEKEKHAEKEKGKDQIKKKSNINDESLTNKEDKKEKEVLGGQNAKITKQILEEQHQDSPELKTPGKISLHRSSGDSMGTIGSGSENEDVYVYLCPFPDCDFTTDFQGMKHGPAAEHCIGVHTTQPWQIKLHGLKWKKVSLEKRMSSMFADV